MAIAGKFGQLFIRQVFGMANRSHHSKAGPNDAYGPSNGVMLGNATTYETPSIIITNECINRYGTSDRIISILKVIIHTALTGALLGDRFLLAVHFRHGTGSGGFVRFLVIAGFDIPRETQRNTFATTRCTLELIGSGLVAGTQRQIGGLHFPY